MTLRQPGHASPDAATTRRRHRGPVITLVVVLMTALLQTASAAPSKPFTAPGDTQESAVTRSTAQVSWAPVPAAPGYRVRATASGKPTVSVSTTTNSAALTGLEESTDYVVRAYVEQPATPTSEAVLLSDSSPANQVRTSAYARRSPDRLTEGKRTPTSVSLSWAPVADLAEGERYLVTFTLDLEGTQSRRTAGPFTGPSGTLEGLAQNTTYFARVHVVDGAGKRVSGSSDVVTAKTLVPRGTITGLATGAPGRDLIAVAYDSAGEAAGQTPVGSDGRYSLSLRPGKYTVQVQYAGAGGLTTRWARTASAGSTVASAASRVSVTLGGTTAAPQVTVGKGATVTGTVKTTGGTLVRDVDVTALRVTTAGREVVTSTRSGTSYTLTGLPDGAHLLRFVYSGDGFKTRSVKLTVSGGRAATVSTTLDNAPFRSRSKPRVSGTKEVGRTLTATATPWLAGSYPTTRAAMSLQWLRDGRAIAGATGSRYTLTRADRGTRVSVRATARRYGYATGSLTSSSYRVS